MEANCCHLKVLVFLFLSFCVENCYAQSIFNQIQIEQNSEKCSLKFTSGKYRLIGKNEQYRLSPDSQKAIILEYPDYGDSIASVEIYNSNGEKSGPFNVILKNDMSLANDGKFVIYGIRDSRSEVTDLSFYNEYGKWVRDEKETFSTRILGTFSESSNFFVLLASKDPVTIKHKLAVKLIIYNKDFNKVCEHFFEDWNRLSVFQTEINEKNNEIRLFRWTGEEEHPSKQTLFFNFNCELLKKETGWVK
jgi:hypothetical protein